MAHRAADKLDTIPVNDAHSRAVAPVFIIGCGRSGNTLLRSMLVAGGEISIPPESYVWPRVVRRFARWRFMKWEVAARNVLDTFKAHGEFSTWNFDLKDVEEKVLNLPVERQSLASVLDCLYTEYSSRQGGGAARWGDKTPLNTRHLPIIQDVFPKAQYIHIVRDPRAVAASYVHAAKTNPGIGETTHKAAALRWMEAVSQAQALSRRLADSRFCEVRYEDLVVHPELELRRLCAFLGISFHPDMLEFYGQAGSLGDVAVHAHHQRVQQALDADRIQGWRRETDDEARNLVERITWSAAASYGYER